MLKHCMNKALVLAVVVAIASIASAQTVEYKLQLVNQLDNTLVEGSGIGGAYTQNDIQPNTPFLVQILAMVDDGNCGIVQSTANLYEPLGGLIDNLTPVEGLPGFWNSTANPLFDAHFPGQVGPTVDGITYDVYQDTSMLFAQPASPIGNFGYSIIAEGQMVWNGWTTALKLNQDGDLIDQHLITGLDCQDNELCPVPPTDIIGTCAGFQRLRGSIYWKPEQCADDCDDQYDDWCHPGNWTTVGLEPINRVPVASDRVVVDWDCDRNGPDVPLAFGGPCFPERIQGLIVGEYGTGRVKQDDDQIVCINGNAVLGLGSLLPDENCDGANLFAASGAWTQNNGTTIIGRNLYMGVGPESDGTYKIFDGILNVCGDCGPTVPPTSPASDVVDAEVDAMVMEAIQSDPNWTLCAEFEDSIFVGVLGQGSLQILGDYAGSPKVIANSVFVGEGGEVLSSGRKSLLRFNRMCGPGVMPENVNWIQSDNENLPHPDMWQAQKVGDLAADDAYTFSGTWEIGHDCGEQTGYFGLNDENLILGDSLVVGKTRSAEFDQMGASKVDIGTNLILGYSEYVDGVYNLNVVHENDNGVQVDEYVDGEYCSNDCPPDLAVGSDAYVGFEGYGEFNHGTGNVRVDYNLEIGYHATSFGVYTMNGVCEETCLDVGCDTVVGNQGYGEFTQEAGLHKVGDNLIIGLWDTGEGVYNMFGGCLNVENGTIQIGDRGVGTFNFEAGRNCVATVIADEINKGEDGAFNTTGTSGVIRTNRFVGFDGEDLDISCTLQVGHQGGAGQGLLIVGPGTTYGAESVENLTVGKHLTVGYNAPAEMQQWSGTVDIDRNLYIGSVPGANDPYSSCPGAEGTYLKNGGELVVGRTMYVGGGGATGSFTQNAGLTQANKVVVDNLNSSGEFNLLGGRFETKEFHGRLTNTGATVAVLGAPGVMTIYGEFEQEEAGTLEARLRVADCDPDFRIADRYCISGSASLAGTLELDMTGYQPVWGDQFCLMSAAAGIEGFFDLVTGGYNPADPTVAMAVVPVGEGLTTCIKAVAAIPGDINLDFIVDAADLQLFSADWNPTELGKTWLDGDFNGDGLSDAVDLQLLGRNWCRDYVPACPPFDFDCCDDCSFCFSQPGTTPAVPEPTTLGLIAVGGLALIRRRRN